MSALGRWLPSVSNQRWKVSTSVLVHDEVGQAPIILVSCFMFRNTSSAHMQWPHGQPNRLQVPRRSFSVYRRPCRDVASGKVGFHVGKEAVPRNRLQALLASGDFERALELARAYSMDENDVYAARLLAMLKKGSGATSGKTGTLG